MAYLGWFVLTRRGIRDAKRERGRIGALLRAGGRVARGARTPLAPEERAALALEYTDLGEWIAQLERERDENARIAGDLIPEADRE